MRMLDKLTLYNGKPIYIDLSNVIALEVETSYGEDVNGQIRDEFKHTIIWLGNEYHFAVTEEIDIVIQMVNSSKE